MNERTIAAIALSNRDFTSFQAKLDEAVRWVTLAAQQGADLIVLPELLNFYRDDGVASENRLTYDQVVLDDWRGDCASLIDAAARAKVAVTIPVLIRESDGLHNVFFFVDADGRVIGQYRKMFPTPDELDHGVVPAGEQPLIEWGGLKIGGGICFDTCFNDGLYRQARAGADLILVPSLWPGGTDLEHFARQESTAVVLAYPAWSKIIDQTGRVVAEGGHRHETLRFGFGTPIVTAKINFDRVALYANHNQHKIVEIQQAYGSDVRIEFDQANCVFYLESRSDRLTVQQVVERFDLITARDYFAECRIKRNVAREQVAASPTTTALPSLRTASTGPIVSTRRLIADGRHNAFTNLIRWRDVLYLTYRQSSGHGLTDGDIVVLKSTDDGQTWNPVPSPFVGGSRTFYEGHMIEHNSNLLMYSGSFQREGKLDKSTQQEFVSVTTDGQTWSPMRPVCEPLWRFWHPAAYNGRLYVAAYHVDYSELKPDGAIPSHCWTVKLMVSDDGIDWQDVSVLSSNDGGNETELLFQDDGTLCAFIRCGAGAKHLIERRSQPPYEHWSDSIDCGQIVEGQLIRRVHDRLFLIGRHRPCHHQAGTIHEDRTGIRTRIWVRDGDYWSIYATLPSGGDTSYAGMVAIGPDRALVSYYSQHPYMHEVDFIDMAGASDIYLAELNTGVNIETITVKVHV